jgi:hypothetical protein
MRQYAFDQASNRGDWSVDFAIQTADGPAIWDPVDDVVSLAMAMMGSGGLLDYGMTRQRDTRPDFVAASNDGTGRVTLVAPGLVSVYVPADTMAMWGAVELIVTLAYARVSDNRKATIWQGRLPLVEGYV